MSIWHKPDEKPIQRQWIVVKYHTIIKATCKYVDKDTYISPVCNYAYVNDLVQDYNRTRKALDRAKWWLKEIVESHRYTPISTAEMALKEITALEQKDK